MKKSFITSFFLMLISLCLYAVTTETYNIQNSFSYTSTQTYTTSQTISPNMTFVKGGSTNLTAIYASNARVTAAGAAYSFSGVKRFLKLLGTTSNAYVSVNVTGPCKIYAYIISVSGTNNLTISDGTTALASKSVTLTGNTFDQLSADYTTCSAGTIQLYSTNSSNGIYLGAVVIEYPDVSPCKIEPTITTLPTLGSVNCGQALSNVSIAGGVAEYNGNAVSGTFSFKTPSTKLKLSDSGVTNFPLVFTPTDTETYNTKEVNVTVTVSDNGNCDPCDTPDGYYMIDCFETANIGDAFNVYKAENTGSATTATVATDPVVSTNQAILFSNKNYGHYLKLNVALPCGRTLNDYESVSFDVYCPTGIGSYQTLNLGINQNLFSTDNNGTNTLTTWTTLVRTFPAGFSTYSGLSSFTFELGFRTSAKDYYIDNVMLKEKAGLAACSTSASDYFRSNATGNWNDINTWQSSSNNSTWISATLAPTSTAASVSIRNGHTVTIAENASVSDLSVVSGATLNINAGKQFNVTSNCNKEGTLELLSDFDGTGTIITNGTVSVGGTYKVNQYLTGKLGDGSITDGRTWWYVASPVTDAYSSVFDPVSVNKNMGYYNETAIPNPTWVQITDNTTKLDPGKGYLFQNNGTNSIFTLTGGKLNSGDITVNVTRTGTNSGKRGFNLIGNPYPSFLNWGSEEIIKTNVRNTIWYRALSGQEMVFLTNDGSFGTGTASAYIPPMQAFWVKVDADGNSGDPIQSTGSVMFSNNARSHQTPTGNKLKITASKNETQQLLRLKVSNGVNSDEALIVSNPRATDNFDTFDSEKMSNENVNIPEIYTISDKKELVINHLNTIEQGKEVKLGFRPGKANSYTIELAELKNFNEGVNVVLYDEHTDSEILLTEGKKYSFYSDSDTSNSRFSLLFKASSVTTSTSCNMLNNRFIALQTGDNQILVSRTGNSDERFLISIYNSTGQKVAMDEFTGSELVVRGNFIPGMYIISASNGRGNFIKKLLIY